MMVFTMIIFWGLLLFGVDNIYVFLKNEAFNSEAKHENGLQFRKMNKSVNAVGSENATTKNQGTEIEFSTTKMQEYLISENEPEFNLADANSIVFPDAETVVLSAHKALSTDYFLKDLKLQANEKTKEAVEYYAFEKRVKEYLTIETELPLQIEDWMINEKCWCHEWREPMSLSQEK